MREHINFIFTGDQQEEICEHYGVDIEELQDFQICELLDRLIGDALYGKN